MAGRENTMKTADPGQAGFSMIELLVAMVMTLIVSGAIFGLLTGGQNAFRREPELTDRQQNIRIAMDLIKRDVAGAGAGMVPFVQAFTNVADGAGGYPTGYTTGVINGNPTDILEVLTTTGGCPSVTLPAAPAATDATWSSGANENLPSCFPDNTAPNAFFYLGSAAVTDRGAYAVRMGRGDVAATVAPFQVVLAGAASLNPTGGTSAGFCDVIGAPTGVSPACTLLFPIDVVRYQIAADPDDATIPALWRSRTGQFSNAGNNIGGPTGGGNWEVVARGIEDMQVEYFRNGTWANQTAGVVFCDAPCSAPAAADYNRLVQQVRVTLSARSTGRGRIQGARTSAGAPTAIRGQLQAVITPRAALTTLTLNTGTPGWF
jgi:prepilin-type N-terminal cleavage/methylation domain-containing protein